MLLENFIICAKVERVRERGTPKEREIDGELEGKTERERETERAMIDVSRKPTRQTETIKFYPYYPATTVSCKPL